MNEYTNEDIEYLGRFFVPREDCNKTVTKENEKISELALIEAKNGTKLSILIGILAAIAVPVIGICINYLFS